MFVFNVFANAGFWVFETLVALLGPSSLLPRTNCPKMVSKMGPKVVWKLIKNGSKKVIKKLSKKNSFGPQNGPQKGVVPKSDHWTFWLVFFLRKIENAIQDFPRCSQDASRWPQNGYKILQDGPKMVPRCPKMAEEGSILELSCRSGAHFRRGS